MTAPKPGPGIWVAVGVVVAAVGWCVVQPEWVPVRWGLAGSVVVLGAVPLAIGWKMGSVSPQHLGLGLGDRKFGGMLLVAGLPAAVLIAGTSAGSPALAEEYPLDPALTGAIGDFALHAGRYLLYYIGFETLFRGYLLLGLRDRIGAIRANVLQSGLATLFHLGKPLVEVAGAFPGSLLFGWAAARTQSIWYGVAAHWVLGVALDWFLRQGP